MAYRKYNNGGHGRYTSSARSPYDDGDSGGRRQYRNQMEGQKFTMDPNDWTFVDDLTGFRYPSSEMAFPTGINQGLVVAKENLEEFDHQLNIESHADDQTVPISRPRVLGFDNFGEESA